MKLNKKLIMATVFVGTSALFSVSTQAKSQTQTNNQINISSHTAMQMAQTAVAQCKKDGYSVSTTVVDASGTPLITLRDDKAGPHTLNSSYHKAFTTVSMKKPTSFYADLIAKNVKLDPLRDMDGRLLFLGGGLPIVVNDNIIGGIGVGGAPGADLDEKCAQAGLDILEK